MLWATKILHRRKTLAVAAVEELWPKKSLAFNELAWPHRKAREGGRIGHRADRTRSLQPSWDNPRQKHMTATSPLGSILYSLTENSRHHIESIPSQKTVSTVFLTFPEKEPRCEKENTKKTVSAYRKRLSASCNLGNIHYPLFEIGPINVCSKTSQG